MAMQSIRFDTKVTADPEEAWRWITSFEGISKEMMPYLKMSAPRGVRRIDDLDITPGKPLFFSWIRLFGILPVDYSRLTLVSLDPGTGFVEESPMGSMKHWRHSRRIIPEGTGCRIEDRLEFEPRLLPAVSARVVRAFFSHRHKMLRRFLSDPPNL